MAGQFEDGYGNQQRNVRSRPAILRPSAELISRLGSLLMVKTQQPSPPLATANGALGGRFRDPRK